MAQLSVFQDARLADWQTKLADRKFQHLQLEQQKRNLVARLANLEEISDSLEAQLRQTRLSRPDEKLRFERELRLLTDAVAVGTARIASLQESQQATASLAAETASHRQQISDLETEIAALKTKLADQVRRNNHLEKAAMHARQLRRECI